MLTQKILNKMKRLFIILTFLALMPFSAINAQDARNRTTATIVADALAQLPAEESAIYNQVMAELAAAAPEGIEMIASMLKPAAEGVNNSPMEYALYGTASYVTKQGAAMREGVRTGLKNALDKATHNPTRECILTALQICATADDAEYLGKLLKDDYLAKYAARALAAVKGTEAHVLKLMQEQSSNNISKVLLAQIASYKPHFHDAEPILIAWLDGATEAEATQIYTALGTWGGDAAAKTLEAAAKGVNYEFEVTNAYGAYMNLLNGHLMKHEPKLVEKAAKKLLKVEKTNVRIAAIDLLVQIKGAAILPTIVKALKEDCREYRYGALRCAEAIENPAATQAVVADALASCSDDATIDVLNWLGANHAAAEIDHIVPYATNANDEIACAALAAASRIGGAEALKAFEARIAADNSEAVNNAVINGLLTFNGSINDMLVANMDKNDNARAIAKAVLAKRRITAAGDTVMKWAKGGDDVANILANIATEKDFNALCDMLEKGKNVDILSKAIGKSLEAKPVAEQVKLISDRAAKAGQNKLYYYPSLAATGSADVIATLVEGYKAGNKGGYAFDGMLQIADDAILPHLFDVATTNADLKSKALARYIALVPASKLSPEMKYMSLRRAIEANPAVAQKNAALTALASTQTFPAMMFAAQYMDDEATAQAAANTVLQIATKHPEFYSAEVKALLEKVAATVNDGDAVYKRKDIEKFISENQAAGAHSIITTLSDKEKAEGFEMLFDGQNMDAWTGNLEAYTPVNGAMYVTAAYGSTGNLYTKKEYADFILRFEFCFEREGVNNGIGLRAEMGKDAAYYGMESQILHHDAPIYANLQPYQVHGSIYGIIPAKRIKWGALGERHTEEIYIKGDRVKVTVDGVVIVDGNIRTACKGHNVAPKGGQNPYTVDKRDHPGLFNKSGHIGLLGHGEGLKYRNIRVKEL